MSSSDSMKAVLIKDGQGPIENLYIGDCPQPQPTKPGQVLVKVKMFGLNRMDISQREGQYPLPPGASEILGVEFSGTVAELGPNVHDYLVGDEVFGLTSGGAYAEYVLVNAGMLLPKPSKLSWEQAAAIPEAWITAYQALVAIANVKEGDDVLIHAGASGVGIAAIQLANRFKANRIITTAGSQEKLDFLRSMPLPPTDTINYKTEDFSSRAREITAGKGVDVIIDFIAQDYWNRNISSLALDGRMVLLATLGGESMPTDAEITPILYKRLRIQGTTLRSRSLEYQCGLVEGFKRDVLNGLEGCNTGSQGEDGHLKIYVHKVYKWTEIQEAHREMELNKNSGKIIVEVTQA
ncbi:hypothetical protein FRC04_005184 [Tulasnella sp. 424]|nr:hypothetical protein FRC04_005184 [Tulasnella sp. 424]KAG8963063.1 hypothetical protein FRC05_004945 [Tulasnella sp. 425]